jgi:hypothetical protein
MGFCTISNVYKLETIISLIHISHYKLAMKTNNIPDSVVFMQKFTIFQNNSAVLIPIIHKNSTAAKNVLECVNSR